MQFEPWIINHSPIIIGVLAVLTLALAGLGGLLLVSESNTRERVETLHRQISVKPCENPKRPACREALRQALDALSGKQASQIVRKSNRYRKRLRRERREARREARRERRRGGGASSTPSASSPAPPASPAVPTPRTPPKLQVSQPRRVVSGPGKSTTQGKACARGNAKFCR